jgi:hypothetical protein
MDSQMMEDSEAPLVDDRSNPRSGLQYALISGYKLGKQIGGGGFSKYGRLK